MAAANLTALQIPDLWVPFDAVVNTHTQAMAEEVGQWLLKSGLCTDPRQAAQVGMIGTFGIAHTIPAARGECARTLSRYLAWAFRIDDIYDSSRHSEQGLLSIIHQSSRLGVVMETPDEVTESDDAFVRSLADIARDMHKLASASQLRRLIGEFRSYVLGSIRLAALPRAQTLPTLSEYLPFRYASGAGCMVGNMVELSLEGHVPDAEIESPLGRAATEMIGAIMVLDNDILSRNKELARGEYDCSPFRVLQTENPQLSIQDAVRIVITLRNRIMELFIKLKDKLFKTASTEMCAYLDALGQSIAGHIKFAETSARYTAGSAEAADKSQRIIAQLPELPYLPSMARWERLVAQATQEKVHAA